MFKRIVFLLLLTFPLTLAAQTLDIKYADSVLISIAKLDKNSTRSELDSFRRKLNRMPRESVDPIFLHMIEKAPSDYTKMLLLGDFGEFLVSRDVPEKAIEYLEKGLELSQVHGDIEDRIWFHVSLANAYIFQNRPEEALEYLNIAESMAEDLDLVTAEASINYSKGMVYESIEDFEQATQRYLAAWNRLNTEEDHPERGFYMFVLVDYFKRIGDIPRQTQFTEILTQYYRKRQPETPFDHLPMTHIFDTSATRENINRYKEAIKVSDSMGALNSLFYSAVFLSNIYLKEDNPELAVNTLEPLLLSLDTTDRKQQKMVLYDKLSNTYEVAGDFQNALKYKEMSSELRDTLVSEKTKKNIAELEVKYDLQTTERELEQQAASKRLLYWILGSVFVVLVIVIFFLVKNRNKNRKLAKQKQLLEATVDEKNVLLKETHHRVKNSFQIVSSLLYLQSENVKDEAAQRAIQEAQNRVRSMVLIHQKLYNKDQLVGIDTREYFNDLTEEIFSSHTDNEKPIAFDLDVESMTLDIESITPIGLILNELITNVLKHAFNDIDTDRKMDISFNKQGEELVLQVTDNGKGMPDEVRESSFGIKLMKALAKKLKASITFENRELGGTVATLNVSRFNLLS
ncbi:hypothetical protein J1N09_03635 [Aureitalea sp. L0-47]|uniref:tetratricopeptide repeat-containing sensor histidine kinase n=1 Tax=Aureitalea sp. L0-47 TaxID=2816962 RepID=UPI0022388682|nr:histidine kinase dimerization/phosphoacceptor domain -containing protein [Aureitalea sp. L0-47]MCW5518915.1 hypothetical protein [Aureitalea sp. L0-47]